jgi:hypothetical protein
MMITQSIMKRYGFDVQHIEGRRRYTRQYDDRLCVVIYEANYLFYFEHAGGITYIDNEAHLQRLYIALTGVAL